MIYTALFDRLAPGRTVRAGVIGVGHYATAVVTQSHAVTRLSVPVVADLDLDAARRPYLMAGYAPEQIATCDSRQALLEAMERGRPAVTSDGMLLMDLPLDVIVESTGAPEASARFGQAAIAHGKHVAMVSKEADVTVGPMLKRLADQAGLVYTAVDGDQHGLLMGLVTWCRELGLEVLCTGKARDSEFVSEVSGSVSNGRHSQILSAEEALTIAPIAPGMTQEVIGARQAALAPLGGIGGWDVTELTIAANALGLWPDTPALHCPPVRISEIPEVLCPTDEGGILSTRGAIECVTCLRAPWEAGLGGGVFAVVACDNDYSRMILTTKGLIPNSRESTALVYRPMHLCGVETPITLLVAGLLSLPTGALEYLPRVDLVARAREPLSAGTVLGGDHDERLEFLMVPATRVADGEPLPFQLAAGRPLAADLAAGTIIAGGMVVPPEGSALWALRQEQDRAFGA